MLFAKALGKTRVRFSIQFVFNQKGTGVVPLLEPPPPGMTAVSRILSGRVAPAWTAISLRDLERTLDPRPSCDGCDVTRGFVRPLVGLRSRRPLPLFCLAPHRVFRAPSVALGAVGSYPAFSPLPALKTLLGTLTMGGLFSVTLSVDRGFHPCLPRILRGMPPYGVRTFLQDCSQRSSTVTALSLRPLEKESKR